MDSMRLEEPATPAGKSLRQLPWLLAAGSFVTLIARISIRGTDVPILGFVAAAVATVGGVLLWIWRNDRQAAETGTSIGALFTCTTTLQYQLLRNEPCLRDALRPVRLSSLVGGWFIGKLFVTNDAVTYQPNAWTRAIFRVPTVAIRWSEIVVAAAVDQPGPRDPGIFEFTTRDGSRLVFMINRNRRLAEVIDDVRDSDSA